MWIGTGISKKIRGILFITGFERSCYKSVCLRELCLNLICEKVRRVIYTYVIYNRIESIIVIIFSGDFKREEKKKNEEKTLTFAFNF